MKQSRNLTRQMKELEELYNTVINESIEPKGFDSEKDVSSELQPTDSGPKGKDNDLDDPIETDLTVKEMVHEDDEESGDDTADEDEKDESAKQSNENTEKTSISNINTSMSDKNVFDKLYSTIMEADDELGDALDIDMGLGGEEEGFDDTSDGGEVTITLTQDQADVLKEVLGQLDTDTGDELEDLDDTGDLDSLDAEEENPFPEGVEAEHTNDGSQPGEDPSGLTGKGNKVKGTASSTPGAGSADGSVTDKVGNDGAAPDSVGKLTSTGSGSNKVAGKITGNNQGLLT